eukprot:1142359-Pelagomonas_calceolata.AAC.1
MTQYLQIIPHGNTYNVYVLTPACPPKLAKSGGTSFNLVPGRALHSQAEVISASSVSQCKVKQNPNQPSLDTESHSPHPRAPPPLLLPDIYKSYMACIYNRCDTQGFHEAITPAPTSFASGLLGGLLARKTMLENKHASKKIKDSFLRALPTHIHTALIEWALVAQEIMTPPLDHNPQYQHYWSTDLRGTLFGAHHNSLSSKRKEKKIISHPDIPIFLSAVPFTLRKL